MLILVVVFVAALVQGMVGFGGALIAMPLLTGLLGIKVAAPAFALAGMVNGTLNTLRWREHVTIRDVIPITIPALLSIPIGVWLLTRVDAETVTRVLGAVLIAYAVYGLVGRTLPVLVHRGWAVVVGVASGILSGAFNTGGPPVVAYADAQRWAPDRFRGNLQLYFLVTGLLVVISHIVAGNYARDVLQVAAITLPALLLGRWVGVRLVDVLSPVAFRRAVMVLLLLLGAQLLVTG